MAPNYNHYNFRPENILKRAEDLIQVDQSDAALETIYEFFTSKRVRTGQVSEFEPIALLFVKLSVDLRNGKLIKDGLHQYKRIVQNSENGFQSVETVVKKFLQLAEEKLVNAQEKADDLAADEEDDEDQDVSPEAILLSAVSTDDTKGRSDRALVNPWIRFLWESYRSVLDVLRNNKNLEVFYSVVAQQAFQFCLKYQRKNEFRKLSEILRYHLLGVQPQQGIVKNDYNVDLNDPETLKRSLDLRFQQLNVSVKLELWQDAFKSVSDVHNLMTVSKRQPNPAMMVSYYENMAKIFAVSDNLLFHAAAWRKFFNLFSQSPFATKEQLNHYSSIYLLAALSVPDEISSEESASSSLKLASLLNSSTIPSREYILQNLVSRKILQHVDEELLQLYNYLEVDFNLITLKQRIAPILSKIESNDSYKAYVKPLSQILLRKLIRAVGDVYDTIKLEYLVALATFEGSFKLSPQEVEDVVLDVAREGAIHVKINHDSKIVTFKWNPFDELDLADSKKSSLSPANLIRYQLSALAETLSVAVDRTKGGALEVEKAKSHSLVEERINSQFPSEHKEISSRHEVLGERAKQLKAREEERKAQEAKLEQERLLAEKKAQEERAEAEALRKQEEMLKLEREKIIMSEKKKVADEINKKGIIKVTDEQLKEMSANDLKALQLQQLSKDKEQLDIMLRSLSKKSDYLERALRKYEAPLLVKKLEEKEAEDEAAAELIKKEIVSKAKEAHDRKVETHNRLKRMEGEFGQFVGELRREFLDAKRDKARQALEKAKQERIAEVIAERKKEIAEEASRKAAEEARKVAEESRRVAEEARKAAEAEAAKPKPMTFAQKMALKRQGRI
ncbi:Translation initiation factor 3 subunit a [Komagataella phaffii CBS 7435]|uniref:Subunit of the core complex of translation initiation factor 3(eIF3) n=2 Tax=Komagataella phaffii TaxID=460519 RepID=C4R493_KOMPG|nr:Subunit of the core complex of translation initiation factor 3(eIF3) [Komagataella phaffii GS115]AOA64003.1 GQ67_03400T0 [Komagataella phaffii]CAH2449870.1 Translation initiation factor 3 subunit a [Komagataella phaffii CBS 7435]AOA68841.1 GQ68_03369T0 [Komagataella phaffii GS115]CAY70379.1 Subunit of the core complex of translation initiation factor 3(eIF3) [Komagataella phaffii GS115]CCA39827.1 Translation initiation factor 3 subunit a [Komagataella phaffii CBS 7435]